MFDKKSIELIKNFLKARNETIAADESVSGGFLQAALSNMQDALQFYQGGITAYNLGQKCRHLKVEPIEAQNNNSVSTKTAIQMALNVCDLFNSDWGLSITGYASPVPESNHKIFAYYAISFRKKIVLSGKIEAKKYDPFKVQLFYIERLLKDFSLYIEER